MIDIHNIYLTISVAPDGRTTSFIDRKAGKDYATPGRPFASIKLDGKAYDATSALFADSMLTLGFGDSGVSARVAVKAEKRYVRFEVASVSDERVQELKFVDIPLKLKGSRTEPFAACALALDLQTNVTALPGATSRLTATCYSKFGLAGADVAIIGCPTKELRRVMQEAVTAAPELPRSPAGGPWALDSPHNRESYLFNFGNLSEKNVDSWIALAKSLGITQIDFHGGNSFRFGDCLPNAETYPNGRTSFKAVIDKLHAAGILAGLHTYAFFFDKACPWVTPIPDSGLAKQATYTLAKDIDTDERDIPVAESTKDVSTTTGFFVRNSIIIQVDDELIRYNNVSRDAPYAFTHCKRGALGTKAAAHAAGAKVHHLKECFGLFAPDPDSPLFTKVVESYADFYNECGFDMVYLDALDGEDVLGGAEWSWHYGSKFVFELMKRLKKPPIMEMSTFHHHLWYARSRMGAWDHPARSYKRFIDIHCQSNESCADMYLPAHLGWWAIIANDSPYREATFSDDIEYLCAKCAAHDCGLSPQGFTPESFASSYNLQRLGGIIKRWEDLRRSGWFNRRSFDKLRMKLKEPGREFTLVEEKGKPRLREAEYSKHKVTGLDSWSSTWTVENRFGAQPAKLRIEALMSAKPYDSPEAVTVIDFTNASQFTDRGTAPGITGAMEITKDEVKAGDASGCFTASRAESKPVGSERADKFSPLEHGQRKTKGGDPSWAKFGAVFSPEKDLSKTGAFGVWVYGDGKGELLNLQYLSPDYLISGIADNYVTVDFTGWRYFELIEPEGERVDDYAWPYSGNSYAIYRELVHWDKISSFSVWLNGLPESGPARCLVSPIKALPLVKAKLANPSVTINGRTITFPVELESGCYIEYSSATDCKLYSPTGDLIREVKPTGDTPALKPGGNTISFSCKPPEGGVSARAKVTVIDADLGG